MRVWVSGGVGCVCVERGKGVYRQILIGKFDGNNYKIDGVNPCT
jgi:hypothetical protein